jgi:hypothetical protein
LKELNANIIMSDEGQIPRSNHLHLVIDRDCSARLPLLGHNLAKIDGHRFLALDLESLLSNILRRKLFLSLGNKSIGRQLNVLRKNATLEVLEVHLEIEIYLLDLLGILFFGSFDLNICYLGPLFIELRFQEFTRLHVELNNFLRTEFKFHIDLLEFGNFLIETFLFIFLFLLLVLKTYPPHHRINHTASNSMIFKFKNIGQSTIGNLEHLVLDILYYCLQFE